MARHAVFSKKAAGVILIMKSRNLSSAEKLSSTRKERRGAKLSAIARILRPVKVEEFLSSYFERHPLIIRGTQEKFKYLFKPDDFKFGLERVSEIRAVFPGLWQAQIHPADIKEMVKAGASICVTGIENAHPKLLQVANSIKTELSYGGTISFRAYLSPPGAGFDLHFDARVATTLQIMGSKRWWFSKAPATEFPDKNSPRQIEVLKSKYALPELDQLRSVLLRPGDLLCLPAGTWHRARAQSLSLSLNLAFDHNGAGVFDVIVAALQEKFQNDPAWRAPLPALIRDSHDDFPVAVAAILRERVDLLQQALCEMRNSEAALKRAWTNSLFSDPQ